MSRTMTPQAAFRVARLTVALGLLLIFGLGHPISANAATIKVDNASDLPIPGGCDLRQAIVAHNEKTSPALSNCTAGDGNDIIELSAFNDGNTTYVSGSPFQGIDAIVNGSVTIKPAQTNVCNRVINSAYITVDSGAKLELEGVGIEVNGAEPRSVIDNDGGTVTIENNGTSGPCLFTNNHGVDNHTTVGGILHNRNGGTVTIFSANFSDSTATDKGGAIYNASGSVTIRGGSFNGNNSSFRGGAIDVERGATLKILSSNFTINNNNSFTGGAIFSDGGIVTMQRDPNQTLASVSIASNKSEGGGAIFAVGGQLTIDGMQFLGNSTPGDGGAIWFSGIGPTPPVSITHTYFRQNAAARHGASIFASGSTVNLSGDTFSHNTGGIYLENSKSSLSVINSTFLGSSQALEGINAAAGSVDVTFSTLEYSALSGLPSKFDLSSSLLFSVACNNVKDASNNLKSSSEPSCPGSVPKELGLSLLLLQDNGGPTPTIALLTGSDAIGAIKLGDCVDLSGKALTIDQRNAPRPGPANPGACDTGAFEFGPATTGLIPPGTPTPF